MRRTTTIALAGTVILGLAGYSEAHAMRCGAKVISRGDHVSKVLRYCGEPDFAQTRSAHRAYSNHFGHVIYTGLFEEVWIQEWTYNLGPRKLMRVIRMENGVVAEIRHLNYGYAKR